MLEVCPSACLLLLDMPHPVTLSLLCGEYRHYLGNTPSLCLIRGWTICMDSATIGQLKTVWTLSVDLILWHVCYSLAHIPFEDLNQEQCCNPSGHLEGACSHGYCQGTRWLWVSVTTSVSIVELHTVWFIKEKNTLVLIIEKYRYLTILKIKLISRIIEWYPWVFKRPSGIMFPL